MADAVAKSLRWSWRLSGASVVMVVADLAGLPYAQLGTPMAWVIVILALWMAGGATRHALRSCRSGGPAKAWRPAAGATAVAAALLVGYTWIILAMLAVIRETGMAEVTPCNLASVGMAVKSYAQDYGVSPATPSDLVTGHYCKPRDLYATGDPAITKGFKPD